MCRFVKPITIKSKHYIKMKLFQGLNICLLCNIICQIKIIIHCYVLQLILSSFSFSNVWTMKRHRKQRACLEFKLSWSKQNCDLQDIIPVNTLLCWKFNNSSNVIKYHGFINVVSATWSLGIFLIELFVLLTSITTFEI